MVWKNRYLTLNAGSLSEMSARLLEAAERVQTMVDAGVTLQGGAEDDAALLVTDDVDVAEQFGMTESTDED